MKNHNYCLYRKYMGPAFSIPWMEKHASFIDERTPDMENSMYSKAVGGHAILLENVCDPEWWHVMTIYNANANIAKAHQSTVSMCLSTHVQYPSCIVYIIQDIPCLVCLPIWDPKYFIVYHRSNLPFLHMHYFQTRPNPLLTRYAPRLLMVIWRVPKIGVPPKHPF